MVQEITGFSELQTAILKLYLFKSGIGIRKLSFSRIFYPHKKYQIRILG